MKRIVLPFAFLLLLAAGSNSCAGDKPADPTGSDSIHDTLTISNPETDSLHMRFRKLVTSMPVPFDILDRFSGAKLPFMASLPNDPDNASQYPDAQSQAVNLGIYGADLAYLISEEKLAESAPYLRSIRKLSDAVVIPSAFDESVMKRYEANKNRQDSMQVLVNSSYRLIDSTLMSNDRLMLATLVIYGGWMESIYLTTQNIGNEKQNEKNKVLFDMLSIQKPYITNISAMLNSFPGDSTCSWLAREMETVKKTFPTSDLPPAQFQERLHQLRDTVSAIRAKLIRVS